MCTEEWCTYRIEEMVVEACLKYFRMFVKYHILISEASMLETHGSSCTYSSIHPSPYLFWSAQICPTWGVDLLKINFLHLNFGKNLRTWILLIYLKCQI